VKPRVAIVNVLQQITQQQRSMNQALPPLIKSSDARDIGFIKEMISMFVEQIPEETEQMTELLKDSNWVQLGKLAHKIKPNFLMMGMEVQQGMAREIEHLCKESSIDTKQVKTLTLQLIEDAKASIPIVESEMNNL